MAVDEAIGTSCISIWWYYTPVYYTELAVIEWIFFAKVMIFYLHFSNECTQFEYIMYNLEILYSSYAMKNQIIFLGHLIEEYFILSE